MILSLAIISFGIWIYLYAAHGGFWKIRRFMAPVAHSQRRELSIVAVVPARDEADVIGASITSLLRQQGINMPIVLVDDSSKDGTAAVAHRAAEELGQRSRLIVIQGLPLPSGWSGKLWAVQQGIEKAQSLRPDFLLLSDADIVQSPDNVQNLVAMAQTGNYDMVSLMVKLHCKSFAERALIPAFVFFFFMLYPPPWIADPSRKTAGAAGGCILIRPQALEDAGGIAAIRHEIIDDCALAHQVKRSGGKIWLGLTEETYSIRPYGSFAAIGRMISRAAFSQLQHSAALLLAAIAGLAVTYLAPPALLLSHQIVPAVLGAAAWLLMSYCFLPMVRFYHLNPLLSLALPVIALFYMGATLHSALKFWSGKGGEWKGRVQDPARP
ncbi:MAG TPA: glycosyltransferase [Candidatus Angelobacter sp.]|nr:glycosyltransferase [Candidatus Angelobacter sp.]